MPNRIPGEAQGRGELSRDPSTRLLEHLAMKPVSWIPRRFRCRFFQGWPTMAVVYLQISVVLCRYEVRYVGRKSGTK